MKHPESRQHQSLGRRQPQRRRGYQPMPWMALEPDRSCVSDDIANALASLTVCEKSCLYWVSLGKTSGEIAQLIERSENTVNFHLSTACRKLAVGSRHAVIRYMLLARLLPAWPEPASSAAAGPGS